MLKKRFKMLTLATVLVAGMTSLVGCGSEQGSENKGDDKFKVTLVLDEGGVNDQSFNESAWNGALEAKDEYGIEVNYIESMQESDYKTNLETAIDGDADLVVGVGFKLVDAIEESANAYPDQKFAIIDGSFEGEIPKNVTPILFNEEQSGYAVGLIAAKMTKTNKIGFVGGMDIPSVTNFLVGYEKAAKEVNPEIEVISQYANSFTDAAKGKAITEQMISNNYDVIFVAGGGVNAGSFEAAREAGKMSIGVDMPSSHIAPDTIITSALKNVGTGLKLTIKDTIDGNFKGGEVKMFDLSNGGVGFEKTDLLNDEVIKFVEEKMNELTK